MEPNRDSSLMWMKSQRNQKWPRAVRDCIRQVCRKLHTSNRRHRDSSNIQENSCKDQTISRPSITANYLHRSPSLKQIHLPGHNTDQEDSSSSRDEVHNQTLEHTPKSVHWGSVSVLHLPHKRPAWREVYKLAPIPPSVQEYKSEDALTNTLGYRNHLPLEIRVWAPTTSLGCPLDLCSQYVILRPHTNHYMYYQFVASLLCHDNVQWYK